MAEYGVGVIGTGWVAGEHLRAWGNLPGVQVVGVASRTRAGAERRLQEMGLACRVYDSYRELLADPAVQIVSICTPPHLHAEIAVAAAEAGKHICLEKPIALNLEQLKDLRDAVRASGVRSVVSFVLRWNPLFETIKAFQADGGIGRVYYAECDYVHGCGPSMAQFDWMVKKDVGGSALLLGGCHAVDALRWFMGSEATEVHALSTRSEGEFSGAFEYSPTEVFLVRFANGAIGKVTCTLEANMPYLFNIMLLGDKGSVRNNQFWSKPKFPGQTQWVTVPTVTPDSADVAHHPFPEEMAHLLDCIRRGVESHCSIEDAIKTHEICLAADLSAAQGGKAVTLPLLQD